MRWGHRVGSKNGPVEVTRAEYNEEFGVLVPDDPVIPLEHVWEWWWKLNNRRSPGFDNPSPLSYTEIKNWSLLTRTIITPSEVELLMAMDDAFLAQVSVERQDRRERDESNKGKK